MATPREQRSLFGEILDWMLAPLLLLWPMNVGLTYIVAQDISNRPYDQDLGDLARTVSRRVQIEDGLPRQVRVPERLADTVAQLLRSDEAGRTYYQVLGLRGELIAGDSELPVPVGRVGAPGELLIRDDFVLDEAVRVAYLLLGDAVNPGEQRPLVQVAETLDRRSRLATDIIKGVMVPQFVVLPLAVLLVWLALTRGLAPLNELQRQIRRRESHDLSPIDERDAPEEVTPLVRAINDLLARLDGSISAQKHFLADAAHQLKTPLAGLRTQAELAQRELDAGSNSQSVKRSLQQIARSSQRAAHMVNQLLAMARAEDKEQSRRAQEVSLARLAIETVRDFVPRAMEKRIDLGYEGPERGDATPRMTGQPLLVREMVRNLVDNALLYTPSGGTVTVRVLADPFGQVAVLQVEDTGPGIPESDRELVFQPFYRSLDNDVDGSGLGLAIVREIAVQHGADISLEDAHPRHSSGSSGTSAGTAATPGTGLRVTVRFPVRPPPRPPVDYPQPRLPRSP
jgi:two-component system sensor histidine kinase TctE